LVKNQPKTEEVEPRTLVKHVARIRSRQKRAGGLSVAGAWGGGWPSSGVVTSGNVGEENSRATKSGKKTR